VQTTISGLAAVELLPLDADALGLNAATSRL
jgi:hypothetical protein